MLPETLLWMLSAAVAWGQNWPQLPINNYTSLNAQNLANPPIYAIPAAGSLTLSVALCSTGSSSPRFFVTNSSASDDPRGGTEISVEGGYGFFDGDFPNGGAFTVQNLGDISFEVGLSDSGDPIHEVVEHNPVFGDSTANEALLFSSVFNTPLVFEPQYPNYTLPDASLSPQPPSSSPNFTLVVSPTRTSPSLTSLPQTGCMLTSQNSTGTVVNKTLWLRDEDGWRTQWIMSGLTPVTNYTAYVIEGGTKVSGPIYFVTKSAAFSCPLVASMPFCPGISYAIPLQAPPSSSIFYDGSSLPASISQPIISSLTNFTTVLLTFACGRDVYSPLMTCADCQSAYRRWLCAVSFPRCSEARPDDFAASSYVSAPSGTIAVPPVATDSSGFQQVYSALAPQPTSSPPRNAAFPNFTTSYTMLLPCLETCNEVDRACPNFLGFRCPTGFFNAQQSYGVGYVDGATDGEEGKGVAGQTQDLYGNVWCNAG